MEKVVKKMDIVTKLYQNFVVEKIKNTDWSQGTTNPLIVELDPTGEQANNFAKF